MIIQSENDLRELIPSLNSPYKILGGGSNILFTKDQTETILLNKIMGIQIIDEHPTYVIVEVGGGEDWPSFVNWAIDRGYGGIENLSLIPGTVGAAPIQNIGAYGVEQSEVFVSLTAYNLDKGQEYIMLPEDCKFSYRDSLFKNQGKGIYFITNVRYRLSKDPELHLDYGVIRERLAEKRIFNPTIKDVSDIVIEIRRSKLPNPIELGNAGSFFKNPIVKMDFYNELISEYPDMPSFNVNQNQVKIPAAWLIENCGWKGKRIGDTGTYEKHALVLVNYGNATGKEIWDLAQKIKSSVEERFKISLIPEVNIW